MRSECMYMYGVCESGSRNAWFDGKKAMCNFTASLSACANVCVWLARLLCLHVCMRATTFWLSNTIAAHTWLLPVHALHICITSTQIQLKSRAHTLTHTHTQTCTRTAICAIAATDIKYVKSKFQQKNNNEQKKRSRKSNVCKSERARRTSRPNKAAMWMNVSEWKQQRQNYYIHTKMISKHLATWNRLKWAFHFICFWFDIRYFLSFAAVWCGAVQLTFKGDIF